ncbi:prepilin-type N-terminal cleavage/methylation domain-containing protein [Nocardioides maradonensis]
MLNGRRRRNDDGFTLPELMITLTILAVILVPLSEVLITYMINSASIRARQFESKDQQLAAQYWSADVASVGQRDATTFAPSNGINTGSCGSAPAGGAALISFTWTTFSFTPPSTTTTPGTTTVTYYGTPSSATSGGTIVRTSCASGSPVSTTIANTVDTLSHAIRCSTDGSTYSACPGISGTGATGVYLRFFSADVSGKGQGYWTVLVGQRRQTP